MKNTIKKFTRPVIVIGIGANDLEIPLLAFESINTATKKLNSLGLQSSSEHPYFFELPEMQSEKIKKALYKDGRYYDGCGECYSLEIRTLTFGKPIVSWDLD